jgi:hypothetical protein
MRLQSPRKDRAGAIEIVTVTICVLAVALAVVLQTFQICCRP